MTNPISRRPFGFARDGTPVEGFTLRHASGTSATVITLGATLQSLTMPDRYGGFADVILGHDHAEPYWRHRAYLGSSVGPFANRIAKGRFSLDGVEYSLVCNDGDNHLHGAQAGLDQKVWTAKIGDHNGLPTLTLSTISADGEDGYPGTVTITSTWTLDVEGLAIEYRASTTAPTIINLTNHAYFNLAGTNSGRSAHDQILTIPSDSFTPVDESMIPTGEVLSVANTPFDFRTPTRISDRARASDPQLALGQGYDHNFVLSNEGRLMLAARLYEPISGRRLDLLTDAPGLQFYGGQHLRVDTPGEGGRSLAACDGVCLEAQSYPDAPNQAAFPGVRLDPGQIWLRRIVLKLTTDQGVNEMPAAS